MTKIHIREFTIKWPCIVGVGIVLLAVGVFVFAIYRLIECASVGLGTCRFGG